jgi:hypothetical protein
VRVLVHCLPTVYFFTLHNIFFFSDAAASSHGTIPRRPLSHYHPLYEDSDDWTPLVSAIILDLSRSFQGFTHQSHTLISRSSQCNGEEGVMAVSG